MKELRLCDLASPAGGDIKCNPNAFVRVEFEERMHAKGGDGCP
jgi:hypothetical protein